MHQYNYTVEYRRSKDHGNADAFSCFPFLSDTNLDGEETEEVINTVCLVRAISNQFNPDNPLLKIIRKTAKDSILSQVLQFVKKGYLNAFFLKILKTLKSWKISCQQKTAALFTT